MNAHPTLRTMTRPPSGRRVTQLALAIAVVLSSLVGGWGAAPAEATSYRFWSYWTGGSDWTFSNQGASRRPVDGDVEGWRFAISPASSSTIPPRHSPSFASLCRSTPAEDGKKRVGLVIDYGTTSDAPDGESPPSMLTTCAVVPEDANGYDVLVTVAQLRSDSGLICGINGYPASECGVPVSDPAPDPTGGSGQGSGDGEGGSGSGDGSSGSDSSGTGPTSGSSASTAGKSKAAKQTDTEGKKDDDKNKPDPDKASPSANAASDATPAAAAVDGAPASPSSGSPIGLIVGLIVVAAVGVTALVLRRRKV